MKSSSDIALAVKVPLSRTIACTPIQLAFALRLDKESGGGVLDKFIRVPECSRSSSGSTAA
ncbi:MAG: hypothetical protein ACRECH_03815 [Nitrososphaerales archaeon]